MRLFGYEWRKAAPAPRTFGVYNRTHTIYSNDGVMTVTGEGRARPQWSKKLANGNILTIDYLNLDGGVVTAIKMLPAEVRQEAIDFVHARMGEHFREQVYGTI